MAHACLFLLHARCVCGRSCIVESLNQLTHPRSHLREWGEGMESVAGRESLLQCFGARHGSKWRRQVGPGGCGVRRSLRCGCFLHLLG